MKIGFYYRGGRIDAKIADGFLEILSEKPVSAYVRGRKIDIEAGKIKREELI